LPQLFGPFDAPEPSFQNGEHIDQNRSNRIKPSGEAFLVVEIVLSIKGYYASKDLVSPGLLTLLKHVEYIDSDCQGIFPVATDHRRCVILFPELAIGLQLPVDGGKASLVRTHVKASD